MAHCIFNLNHVELVSGTSNEDARNFSSLAARPRGLSCLIPRQGGDFDADYGEKTDVE